MPISKNRCFSEMHRWNSRGAGGAKRGYSRKPFIIYLFARFFSRSLRILLSCCFCLAAMNNGFLPPQWDSFFKKWCGNPFPCKKEKKKKCAAQNEVAEKDSKGPTWSTPSSTAMLVRRCSVRQSNEGLVTERLDVLEISSTLLAYPLEGCVFSFFSLSCHGFADRLILKILSFAVYSKELRKCDYLSEPRKRAGFVLAFEREQILTT